MKLLHLFFPTLGRPDPIYAELRARNGMQTVPMGTLKKVWYYGMGTYLWLGIWAIAGIHVGLIATGQSWPNGSYLHCFAWAIIAYRFVGARLNLAFMRWAGWGDDALAASGWTPPSPPRPSAVHPIRRHPQRIYTYGRN